LTENWLIFITRGGSTFPSWQLIGAIFGVDVLATLFCLFGWIAGPVEQSDPADYATFSANGHTDIITVVIIWLYSLGVTIVIAMVYYLLNKIERLDNLGRKTRSKTDITMENILGQLQKVAIEHETLDDGKGKYTFAPLTTIEDDE